MGCDSQNSWMSELEIEELEKKVLGSGSVIVEVARSVEVLPDHVGEYVRNVLLEMGSEEHAEHCYGNCRSDKEEYER